MSKSWNGPTPPIISGSLGPLMDAGFAIGYKAAMNSPEIRAMHEALEMVTDQVATWPRELYDALAAYKAGLKDEA